MEDLMKAERNRAFLVECITTFQELCAKPLSEQCKIFIDLHKDFDDGACIWDIGEVNDSDLVYLSIKRKDVKCLMLAFHLAQELSREVVENNKEKTD